MGKITIKNISTATVSIVDDSFRRELVPGRVIQINKVQYENLMLDPGFSNLIESHYIFVDGIDEQQAAVQVKADEVFDVKAISDMLDSKDYSGFAKFLPKATAAEKDTVVKLAVDKGINDSAFTALIKKYCGGVDVVSAFNIKRQVEE